MSLVGSKIVQICDCVHHAALHADSQRYITRPRAGHMASDLRHRDCSLGMIQVDATTLALSQHTHMQMGQNKGLLHVIQRRREGGRVTQYSRLQ